MQAACCSARAMLSPAARPAAGGRPLPRMAARRRVAYGALDGKGGEGGGGKGGGEGTSTGGSGEAGTGHDIITKGTPVFDASHKNNRGYGVADSWPEWDEDGDLRSRVRFDGGQRATWIKHRYLEVPAIQPDLRQDPTAVKQRVMVVVGPHKKKEGTTVKKCGELWTVKLDGVQRHESFAANRLHAIEAPAPATTLEPFTPECLEEGLALDRISIYLHGYCSKPDQPTDLVRRTPETALWFAVLEERRSIDDLSDAEVDGLRYLLSGVDASSATADVRERLRQKKDAAWTIKYTCARARHTGCPFALEFRHRAGASTVDVWATERHHFHDPTSADSLAHLKMAPEVEEQLRLLFAAGAKPYASWVAVNCNNLVELGDGSLRAVSDARYSITLEQVWALRKRWQRESGYGRTSDAKAVALQMQQYRQLGWARRYEPYQEGQQPLRVCLQTDFQARCLAQFGSRLAFWDSTFGTNMYGYPLSTLMVMDDQGRGVPVGFLITTEETTEVLAEFLRDLLEGARQHVPTFKYSKIMVDKARNEIAAIRLLQLAGEADGHLLCYFHFLQEWERFVRSAESGVSGKEAQHRVMRSLAHLAHVRREAMFETQLSAWYRDVMAYPAVVVKMTEHWAPCARHWAWWGRLDVLDLCANTNNLLERFFGLLKYIHLERSTQHSLQRLINLLLERVVPASILRRRQALAGRGTSSDQRQYEQRLLKWIKKMVDDGDVTPEPAGSAPGLTSVRRGEGKPPHKTCVGDLSCSCSYNEDEVCTHLKAAAQVIGGFTPALRAATADYLLAGGQIQVDAAHRCSCLALAAPLRPVVFSPLEGECTCFDRALHGTCCHLLAAARLPQFEGMELPAGPPVPDANVAYNINIRRTFQLPASEPLGDDWGQAELQALVGAPQRCAAAIQQATGNADLEIAAARRAAAYAVSVADSLPEGEQRQAVLAALAEAQRLAEGAAASAKLPATAVRAGKIGRRLNSRGEELRADGQRRVRPLLNRAGSKRPPLVAEEGIFCGNEFKKRARKGKATDKVRGVIANEDGTTLRGGPHHRKGKGRRKGRKGRKA